MPEVIFSHLIFPYLTLRYERAWECISDTWDSTVQLVNVCDRQSQTVWISNVLYIPTFSVSLHTIFSVNISHSWNRRPSRARRRTGHWHKRLFKSQKWSDWGDAAKKRLEKWLMTDDKPARKRKANNKQYLHCICSLFNFVALLGKPTFNCRAVRCQYECANFLIS